MLSNGSPLMPDSIISPGISIDAVQEIFKINLTTINHCATRKVSVTYTIQQHPGTSQTGITAISELHNSLPTDSETVIPRQPLTANLFEQYTRKLEYLSYPRQCTSKIAICHSLYLLRPSLKTSTHCFPVPQFRNSELTQMPCFIIVRPETLFYNH